MIILILLHSTTLSIVTGTCNGGFHTVYLNVHACRVVSNNTEYTEFGIRRLLLFSASLYQSEKRNFLEQLTHISFRKGFLTAGIILNKKPCDILAFTLFSVILILLFHFPYEITI